MFTRVNAIVPFAVLALAVVTARPAFCAEAGSRSAPPEITLPGGKVVYDARDHKGAPRGQD
jgi:hypothetical protein